MTKEDIANKLLWRTYNLICDPFNFDPEEADSLVYDIAVYLDEIKYNNKTTNQPPKQ